MKRAIDKSTSCWRPWGSRDRRRVGLPEPRKRERGLIDQAGAFQAGMQPGHSW